MMALLMVGASPALYTDYPTHNHDCYEIILNTEGEGEAQIGASTYPFCPGTIHVIPPHTPHRKRSEQGFRDLYVHTDCLSRAGLAGEGAFAPEEPLVLTDDGAHTMEHLVSALLGRSLLRQDKDAITRELFELVLRLLEDWSHRKAEDPVISSVIHTIAASYSDPEFQVTQALLATGYSKDHLRRRFVQVTGMTPGQYLRSLRIRKGKQLLEQKVLLHLSVSEIAGLCGFYDPSYFCRVFEKEVGMAPSAYSRAAANTI